MRQYNHEISLLQDEISWYLHGVLLTRARQSFERRIE